MPTSRGVVSVFTRKNCPYCVYVTDLLRTRVDQINREFNSEVSDVVPSPPFTTSPPLSSSAPMVSSSPLFAAVADAEAAEAAAASEAAGAAETAEAAASIADKPSLSVRTYDCSDGARAAQCISYVGGTTTVPHVFFNRKYVGDANSLIDMESNELERLLSLLREAAAEDCQDFPPTPDASMIKITDGEAFSSQPTVAQLRGLHSFGFRSLINVLDPEDQAYFCQECAIIKSTGIDYFHMPFGVKSTLPERIQTARQILARIASCRKPVLIHCDTGRRACALTLLYAATVLKTTVAQVRTWGKDLGHNFHAKSGIPYAWVSSFLEDFEQAQAGVDQGVKSSPVAAFAPAAPEEAPVQIATAAAIAPGPTPNHPAPPLPPPKIEGSTRRSKVSKVSPQSGKDAQKLWRENFPVHAAACGAVESSLEQILKVPGVDVKVLDEEGWSPLHYAAWNGISDSISLLLCAGADVATRTGESRNTTALHYAAGMGHIDCVRLLLDAGADAAAQDAEGWTPGRVAEEMSRDSNFMNQSGPVSHETWQAIIKRCAH